MYAGPPSREEKQCGMRRMSPRTGTHARALAATLRFLVSQEAPLRSPRQNWLLGVALALAGCGGKSTDDNSSHTGQNAPILPLVQIDASSSHACGLSTEGKAYC